MSDETEDDYIWRMCCNKENGIYKLTWDELADILNEELCKEVHKDTYRKPYEKEKKGYQRAIKNSDNAQEYLEEIEQKIFELEIKKKKTQTQTVSYNKILREGSRQEMLFEQFIDAVESQRFEVPNFEIREVQPKNKEFVLSFSDMHAYKIFKTYRNEYSKEILENRMDTLLNEVVNQVHINKIKHLYIVNGGDDLEGVIRISQLQSLELGLVDSIIEFRAWLAEWLNRLSAFVDITYIQPPSSNHTEIRLFNQSAGQNPKDDAEKLIISYLKGTLKDNHKITIPDFDGTFANFKLFNYNCLVEHGHNIKNPYNYLTHITRRHRIFYDYFFMGHYHHMKIETLDEGVDNDCDLIGIPSIVGTDPYSETILKSAKPSALFLEFTEGSGKTCTRKILL